MPELPASPATAMKNDDHSQAPRMIRGLLHYRDGDCIEQLLHESL